MSELRMRITIMYVDFLLILMSDEQSASGQRIDP